MWLVLAAALFYGPYNATVVEVLDAETIRFNVAVWPGEQKLIEINVYGVDTPSLIGRCDAEDLLAKDAIQMTRTFIGKQARITDIRLIGAKPGEANSGKIYANVRNIKGQSLSKTLIESGYGVVFEKGKQADWCH